MVQRSDIATKGFILNSRERWQRECRQPVRHMGNHLKIGVPCLTYLSELLEISISQGHTKVLVLFMFRFFVFLFSTSLPVFRFDGDVLCPPFVS